MIRKIPLSVVKRSARFGSCSDEPLAIDDVAASELKSIVDRTIRFRKAIINASYVVYCVLGITITPL